MAAPNRPRPRSAAIAGMLRDIGVLMRGTAIAQAVGLLALPILSRLYSPANFGDFAFYQASILLLTVIACLRYDQAILTARDDAEAVALFKLCAVVAFVMSVAMLPFVIAIDLVGFSHHVSGSLSPYWLIPGMFLSGLVLAANGLLTRLGAFATTAATKICQSTANSAVALVFGALAPSGIGLILADLVGKAGAVLMTLRHLAGQGRLGLLRFDLGSLLALARRFSSFPRLSVLGGLLNNGGSFLTPVMLYAIYGAHTAGQFSLVDRSISLPLSLIIVAVSQVFSSHYARLLREEPDQALSYFLTLVRTAALAGIIPLVMGILLSPIAFRFIFGAAWTDAGYYAQILAVMYYSAAISGPINTALIVANRLRWQLRWELGRLVLYAALWTAVAGLRLGVDWALAGYAAATVFVNISYVAIAYLQLWQTVDAINSGTGQD